MSEGARPGLLRRHPILVGVWIACALGGLAVGVAYLPAEWSLLRRLLAGGFAGVGTALLLTFPRLYD